MKIEDFFSSKQRFYPDLSFSHIKNPNKWLSFPLFGFIFKGIVLTPVFIELIFLVIVYLFVVILINPFVILFSGKYWQFAYELNLGVMRLSLKAYAFFTGLTNQYPWFNLKISDELFSLNIEKPKNPNRILNFPILGILFKMIILLPFWIVDKIVNSAAGIAYFFSSLPIFFQGKYPESAYEITRDYFRLSFAACVYLTGLSDIYPSMYVSLNHKKIKIFLLILGILISLSSFSSSGQSQHNNYNQNSFKVIYK
jgi:hypothetical protein